MLQKVREDFYTKHIEIFPIGEQIEHIECSPMGVCFSGFQYERRIFKD